MSQYVTSNIDLSSQNLFKTWQYMGIIQILYSTLNSFNPIKYIETIMATGKSENYPKLIFFGLGFQSS